jgi:predicted permease
VRIEPPRLAVRLLTWRLGHEWRDYVVGDLVEEFESRSDSSVPAARRWFWRQTVRCLAAPPREPRHLRSAARARVDRPSWFGALAADLRDGLRVVLRAPSFSLAVIAVLALGIGANVGVFTIVNAVLLRPLPFEQPDRLVRLFHIPPPAAFPGIDRFALSAANFYDWQQRAQLFERMAIYRFRELTLMADGQPRTVVAGAVGDGFFEIVGTRPALGRTFRPEEDAPGRGHVVIVSDGFWKRHLGAVADVIGRPLTLDGQAYEIVGVMPPSFSVNAWGATGRELWVPLAFTSEDRLVRENHNHQAVARVKPGVDVKTAAAELAAISVQLEAEYPKENAGWGATIVPLHELIGGDIRPSLVLLLGAVALVLLIACANVGNLLLARGLARQKELAVRAALGAGRARLIQQLLAESLVLALAGGVAGLLIARASIGAGAALLASQVPRADELAIDGRVWLFVAGLSIAAGLFAGTIPAFRAGRSSLTGALREGGRGDGGIGVRTRRALIVGEVALSVVLLMAAGVMFRSLMALRSVDAGFDPRGVLTLRVSPQESRYDTDDKTRRFFVDALERLRALPGVEVAGAIDSLPTQGGSVQPIVLEGHAEQLPRDQPTVEVRLITPGYLHAMRIPILNGRDVADSDVDTLLVSKAAAKLLWGDGSPIGRRVTLPLMSRTIHRDVIGVVGDVKQGELADAAAPTVYQYSRSRSWSSLVFTLRTSVVPESLIGPATAAIRDLDAQQPVQQVRTMSTVLDETLTAQRFSALLFAVFAGVALVLASVGIYSVLSHLVRGRTREIGIRTALGASTGAVLRLVVGEGMAPALTGIAIGCAIALAAATWLERLVFGVSASDPLTLAFVAGTLTLVALAASLAPAWRASRLDPLKVLRA